MRVPFVDLARQFRELQPELQEALRRVGESGMYVLGPENLAFEREFAAYCGSEFAVAVANGSDALLLPLLCLNLGPQDEVITAPNSFVASAWVIHRSGAKIVFCDVEEDSMNLDPELARQAITPNTRALLPVHLTGRVADMEALGQLGLPVVEDAAQAVGARRHGRRAGSLGWCAGFSLHPLKNLHVYGDGGVITTNDAELVEQLRKLRNHGLQNRDCCEFWGLNSRLDEVQAAFLRCKMPLLDPWTERFRAVAGRYRKALDGKMQVPSEKEGEEQVYHRFMVRHPERDRLADFLLQRGVETRVNYPIPLHLQPAAKSLGYGAGDFPVAEKLARSILSLPCYPELSDAEVDFVIESVLAFPD